MSDQDKPKFPRQGKPTKATDANQALIAAVSLLSASLGVTAATPADAATVDVHPQVQTPKLPSFHSPTLGSPKVTKIQSNYLKIQSNSLKIQSNSLKIQSNQDKIKWSQQQKGFQSNQDKSSPKY
jgi:hypothetical protein